MAAAAAVLVTATSCVDVAPAPGNSAVNQGYPAQAAPQPQSHPIRDLFASTIAAVLQTTSMGIASGISGGIINWFAAKTSQNKQQPAYASGGYPAAGQYPSSSYPSSSYPSSTYPSSTYPSSTYPSSSYPSSTDPSSSYPSSSYPSSSYPGSTYPSTAANPGAATQYPSSGYPSSSYPQTASGYPNSSQPYPAATPPGSYPDASAYPNSAPQYPSDGSQYPSSGYPTASTYPNTSSPYPDSSGYPNSAQYPSAQYPNASYPSSGAYDSTGSYGSSYDSSGALIAASDASIYAGIAYEVHALSPDGHWVPADPATYQFRSGDRFMVYYRPSLPGRMHIYNINPLGKQTLIDATDMAAGQLAGLGPYEFTSTTGDETLRLVLAPCSTPQLLVATRDIVKADVPPPGAAQTGGGVNLENCSVTATRAVAVRTRDIQKVAQDGTTNYALDPVSQQELNTGDVESRQVTIVFHHPLTPTEMQGRHCGRAG